MAAFPLSIAVPAAAASLAYLNARTAFISDIALLRSVAAGASVTKESARRDRVNLFYKLEELALSSKSANRIFLAVPPEIPTDVQTLEDLRGLACIEWTYREVYDKILQFAAWLRDDHQVRKGDIVALNFKNSAEFVFIWFAIWSLGAKAGLINTGLREKALLHCVTAAQSKLLILDPLLQETLSPEVQAGLADAGVKVTIVDDGIENKIYSTSGYRAPDKDRGGVKHTDLALLIYTSGTTGLPKPAVVPWRRFHNSAKSMATWLGMKPTDRYYTAMPLYHSAATILGLGVTLQSGATFVISPHFSPRTFFASTIASRATMMQYIGEMCRYLASMPASPFDKAHRIRLAFGNGLRPDVWKTFKQRFAITEIVEFYSATEAVAGSFVRSKNDYTVGAVGRSGSLLRLLYGSRNAIIKHDMETGEPWRDPTTGLCVRVNTGESGELLNKLDPANISDGYVGYYNNEKASESKILRNVFEKGDAWYRSGDLLKADKDGRTFFVDRIGDTYRWKSENVSTNEVAEAMGSHAAIEEVNVYGVQLPNHDGRAGCAAVMLRSESNSDILRGLAQHALQRLPRYAVPIFIRVVKQFEITGTNKYTKHGLRTQGVDPSHTGEDKVYWLPPKAQEYQTFSKRDWESISGGGVKL